MPWGRYQWRCPLSLNAPVVRFPAHIPADVVLRKTALLVFLGKRATRHDVAPPVDTLLQLLFHMSYLEEDRRVDYVFAAVAQDA